MILERRTGKFEWDSEKNEQNIRNHGIDFNQVGPLFDWWHFTQVDYRHNGELRERTIGRLPNGQLLCVIHTSRDDSLRIISARRANRKEVKELNAYIKRMVD